MLNIGKSGNIPYPLPPNKPPFSYNFLTLNTFFSDFPVSTRADKLVSCRRDGYNCLMQKDLKNYTRPELRELVASMGQKAFLADYLYSFIHQKDCGEIAQITPLPQAFREQLAAEGFFISRLKTLKKLTDPDGASKYLFQMEDGQVVESVRLIDEDRVTLCLSTQVGCRMACGFCATGRLSFQRNLLASEIIDQVYRIEADGGKAQNLVYMGMGEPLDNYDETMRSLRILNSEEGRRFGIRHITLSTCGITERIRQLAGEDLHPRLAISLHAADDAKRSRIMPISRKETLDRLIEAIRFYQDQTGRRITLEYIMIRRLNDTPADLENLIRLAGRCRANVNLIEFNEFPGAAYKACSPDVIRAFAAALQKAGIETVIRFKRGRAIKAACGQLGAERLPRR